MGFWIFGEESLGAVRALAITALFAPAGLLLFGRLFNPWVPLWALLLGILHGFGQTISVFAI